MKIGMNLPVMVPGLDREAIHEWSRRIDAGPYRSLAAGERITFPNPEIMVTLATAAALTERVRITFSVLVLPMHNPIRIAKQVATLDVLSGGRVSLGVGVGGREEDYAAVGAEYDKSIWKRMEEQVAVMRRAWKGEQVIEGALRPVEPLPLQKGGPELLAGSMFPRSIRRAARWADGICGFSFGPHAAEIANQFELARSAWKEEGRAQPPRLVTSFWFALGPNARSQLDEYLLRYLNFMGPDAARKLAPSVTTLSPAALKDAARMVADLGCDELILVPTTADPDEVDRVADILELKESGVAELEQRIHELEQRLAAVEAVQEITRLKARYAELIDSRYSQDGPRPADVVARIADRVVALFAADAVWDGGADLGCWRGRDEIRKRFLDPTLKFTIHYFVQPRIEVDGDRASGRWDILAPVTFGNGKPGWMTGIEDDEYVRRDGAWLHARMKLTVHFMVPYSRGWGGGGGPPA